MSIIGQPPRPFDPSDYGAASAPTPVPSYALFDSTSVTVATLLGSPVAGSILMALNSRRLGKRQEGFRALGVGVVITGLAIGLGLLWPQAGSSGLAIGLVVAMRQYAKTLQGSEVERHKRELGPLESRWKAAGIGIAVLVLLLGPIFLVLFIRDRNSKVIVGSKDAVYYSGAATKNDAEVLGQALKTLGYFKDRGVAVMLSKGKNGTVVSFVVKAGSWEQEPIVTAYEEIGRELAPSIGGFPVKVGLTDSARQTKREMTVGRILVGSRDQVYYLGSASEADGNALGQALKAANYLQDRGVTVMLSKNGNGTTISLVVREGSWERPQIVAALAQIIRQIAPSVGGLPITLRLLDSRLNIKKEIPIT